MKAVLTLILILVTTYPGWCEPLYLVSDDSLPPYSFYEEGEPRGIDVDVMTEAARRAGVNVEIALFPWKRTLMMLEAGQADGAFSLFRTDTRERFAVYSRSPVHISELEAYMSKNALAVYRTIENLYGKTVLVVAGFSISDKFDAAVKRKAIRPVYVLNAGDGLKRLLNSDNGCFISNRVSVLYYAHQLGLEDRIEAIPPLVRQKRAAYLALSKAVSKIDEKLDSFKKLDAALGRMHKDGTLVRITNSYLK